MKFILSRKGYDSQYGGGPSPVFADGTMLSLPIPETDYLGRKMWSICTSQLRLDGHCNSLFVHLDPDIRPELYETLPENWTPLFGQDGIAARHLMRGEQYGAVAPGDVFLFFGLFRFWDEKNFRFGKENAFHAIWGYMRVQRILDLGNAGDRREAVRKYPWHPHVREAEAMRGGDIGLNVLFVGDRDFSGTFRFAEKLRLTQAGSACLTHWDYEKIPWVEKGRASHMTYHQGADCMKPDYFQAAVKGQEFVIDERCSETISARFFGRGAPLRR